MSLGPSGAQREEPNGSSQPSEPANQYPSPDTVKKNTNRLVKTQLEAQNSDKGTAFWNVNVPASEHTEDCPEYLRYAFENDKDRGILAMLDADYQRQTWEEVRQLIKNNRLDLFMRTPSELRLYREYCAKLVQEYGSIMRFVMQERLHWENLNAGGPPFSIADDYKILYNDWPYAVDERVGHLVVWSKFELPADPSSDIGDLLPETRKQVNDFVEKTFVAECGRENVIWFKNWASLKSIHAVEHFHVMLFDPDMDFVRRITNGDIPLFQKVKMARSGAP